MPDSAWSAYPNSYFDVVGKLALPSVKVLPSHGNTDICNLTTPTSREYRTEVEDAKQKLEEACRRLEELLKRREEEMRRWEETLSSFIEEELDRLREEWQNDPWRDIFDFSPSPSLQNSPRTKPSSPSPPPPPPPPPPPLYHRPTMGEAWTHYEQQWELLPSVSSGLTFGTIPWPVLSPITMPESLRSRSISEFILSSEHSLAGSRRRRILDALRRWHTDHFDAKILHKVVERDRTAVQEGVGKVVRCLNDMLAAERY